MSWLLCGSINKLVDDLMLIDESHVFELHIETKF